MNFKYQFLVILHLTWILHFTTGQECTLPSELWGTWTSTNLGTVTITGTTPSLSITQMFTGQTGSSNDFNCRYVSGTRYVLQAVSSFAPFTGTSAIYIWMCIDLRRASDYTYYYYLHSEKEGGFDNYRLVGLPGGSSVTVNNVCTTTLDVAEFNTMIKTGEQSAAVEAVQCPEPLLGQFTFTYSDSSVTSTSSNTSYVTACGEWNRTHIFTNSSGLSGVDPFYTTEGVVGCIANVYDATSGVYYTSLYNLDASPNPEFICVATEATGGSVYLSMKQLDCDAGQSPTVLPTNGALMVLSADYTCLPPTESKSQTWVWLIVLLPCICVLIMVTVMLVCLHIRVKKRERDVARTKKTLKHENHPLGEMSMPLDAPPSLVRRGSYIDEDEEDLLTTPRRKRAGRSKNIFGEQSLNLNLDNNKWSHMENIRLPAVSNGAPSTSNGVLGKRRLQKNHAPSLSEISTTRSQTYKSSTARSNVSKSTMLEKKIANSKQNGFLRSQTNLKLRTANKPSISRPGSSKKNGVHPAPRKPLSRPSSSQSRRGSIDNLVIDRNKRALSLKRPQRSKTIVLSSNENERGNHSVVNSPSDINTNMFTMPEEYQIEGGPNQLIPERPSHISRRSLEDAHRSLRTFRNNTGLRLQKPSATRNHWR